MIANDSNFWKITDDREKKLKTFAKDILKQCQNKGLSMEEVNELPQILQLEVAKAINTEMKNVAFTVKVSD